LLTGKTRNPPAQQSFLSTAQRWPIMPA
jgi:hypothetical protein